MSRTIPPHDYDMAFDVEAREYKHDPLLSSIEYGRAPYVHNTYFSMPSMGTCQESGHVQNQLRAIEHSIHGSSTPPAHIPHRRWKTSQECTSASAPAHVNQHITQPNSALWGSTDAWMGLESFPTASSSLAPARMNETDAVPSASSSYPTYDSHLHDTYRNNPVFDPSRALMLNSSDGHLPPAFVGEEHHNLELPFDQSSAHLSPSFSSQAAHSYDPSRPTDLNVAGTYAVHHLASPPSLNPPFSQPPELNLQSRPVLHQDSAISFRRKQAACAIEYDGLWIDEEELFKGLTEPNGKLTVHSCRWEEDWNPCYLWIKGGKSSMNAHIQRWHGGKAGGEKIRVDCRWSTCKKTMRKESITRHIVSTHLGEKWRCQVCGKAVTRNDTYWQHAEKSKLEACNTTGALITYATDVRVIDARAALGGGGRMRYAG